VCVRVVMKFLLSSFQPFDDVVYIVGIDSLLLEVNSMKCDVYFPGHKPCGGGVMALDGRNGHLLWQHYSRHELYALTCVADLNGDHHLDCLAAGRAGVSQLNFTFMRRYYK
jgi:hypothetical protein